MAGDDVRTTCVMCGATLAEPVPLRGPWPAAGLQCGRCAAENADRTSQVT